MYEEYYNAFGQKIYVLGKDMYTIEDEPELLVEAKIDIENVEETNLD